LIKTLATEVKLCEAFEEKAYTYVVEFHEFCFKTLPQSIILAVLKYLGVPDVNIDFFTRFLTENLDNFEGVTNLSFDVYPGDLHIGFLKLIRRPSLPSTLALHDPDLVTNYAHSVLRRLNKCTTILDWILVWNRTAGTYAAHLFGPLAHILGPLAHILGATHLATVKKAYVRLFAILFPNSNLTAHLRQMLQSHFPSWYDFPVDVPLEPLIYLPQACGGLGVKTPFTTLALAHDVSTDADEPSLAHTYNWLLGVPETRISPSARRAAARTSAHDLWVLQLHAKVCFEAFGGPEA
jgi:hypothetical protein